MSYSTLDICNIALAKLGEDAIQSLDDNNRRARMCKVFFNLSVLAVLSEIDWAFAKRFKGLQEAVDPVGVETDDVNANIYTYDKPSDCLVPRDIFPRGSTDFWVQVGPYIQTNKSFDEGVYLYYTTSEVRVSEFTPLFVTVVAAHLAVTMATSLTQDSALLSGLIAMYNQIKADAWHSDTNIGNDHISYDGNPENDSFVNI